MLDANSNWRRTLLAYGVQLVPPNFYHQVSCSRRQFSLARIFFFSARLFVFDTTFFSARLFFLARLFLLNITGHRWPMAVSFDQKIQRCGHRMFEMLFFVISAFNIILHVHGGFAYLHVTFERWTCGFEHYFQLGLGYSEILLFLGSLHGCFLSLRQRKRILNHQGLGRQRNRSNPREVCQAIEQELRGSGSTIGYRQMTQRLLHAHGITTDKESERQRRKYKTAGPNHLWHIDGYDKLKPFDFCIHGAIDGYSRHIMWIEVGSTNNDPFVIAQYY